MKKTIYNEIAGFLSDMGWEDEMTTPQYIEIFCEILNNVAIVTSDEIYTLVDDATSENIGQGLDVLESYTDANLQAVLENVIGYHTTDIDEMFIIVNNEIGYYGLKDVYHSPNVSLAITML